MVTSIFYPKSSADYMNSTAYNQVGRSNFGDKRLAKRYDDLMALVKQKGSVVFHQLSTALKDTIGAYRFINNSRVSLGELIYQSCRIEPQDVTDQDLIAYIDGTEIGVKVNSMNKSHWAEHYGVHGGNQNPGFYLYPSLIMSTVSSRIIGLGDMLIYNRPLTKGSKADNIKQRTKRRLLGLEQQESGVWPIVARNTNRRLIKAKRLTFVMDQGGDIYESLQQIETQLGRDFIVRVKNNRQAKDLDKGIEGRFSDLLGQSSSLSYTQVPIRGLNHYSKTRAKRIKRRKRQALLGIKYIRVALKRPAQYIQTQHKNKPSLDRPLYLVEVKEHPSTVPSGEDPIHWRLLTTWSINGLADAQKVVQVYQNRWNIEQLFRILKEQGFKIERSQYRDPYITEKLAVMALKASADALQLVQVRDSQTFVPIQTMFTSEQCQVLSKFNEELSGQTLTVINPHAAESLSWAAWIIARLGGWKGYASQRPPGPITMDRGLKRFRDFCTLQDLIKDT
jgi:hypothetical protein